MYKDRFGALRLIVRLPRRQSLFEDHVSQNWHGTMGQSKRNRKQHGIRPQNIGIKVWFTFLESNIARKNGIKWMVGILLSYWGGLFSGTMLLSGRVNLWSVVFCQSTVHHLLAGSLMCGFSLLGSGKSHRLSLPLSVVVNTDLLYP